MRLLLLSAIALSSVVVTMATYGYGAGMKYGGKYQHQTYYPMMIGGGGGMGGGFGGIFSILIFLFVFMMIIGILFPNNGNGNGHKNSQFDDVY